VVEVDEDEGVVRCEIGWEAAAGGVAADGDEVDDR
jgi:hypothetical protein